MYIILSLWKNNWREDSQDLLYPWDDLRKNATSSLIMAYKLTLYLLLFLIYGIALYIKHKIQYLAYTHTPVPFQDVYILLKRLYDNILMLLSFIVLLLGPFILSFLFVSSGLLKRIWLYLLTTLAIYSLFLYGHIDDFSWNGGFILLLVSPVNIKKLSFQRVF